MSVTNSFEGRADVVVQAGKLIFGATGDVPVGEAVRSLDPVCADVLRDGFTGRRWLIEQIDGFLASRPCGYLWIEGDAGVGKTALAAHLVRERGWPGHFSRLTRGGSARVALRNLAGRLAVAHGFAPDGLLPGRWCTPEGFETLLAQLTPPVVLVVDGADEAERVPGAQPWGLPNELPAGVFVVGTYRTGSPPPLGPSAVVLRLAAADPRNVADVVAHAARVQPDLAGVARCGGVWIYLRYVLNEIRQGVRAASDPLPANLSRYYTGVLESWPEEILPLVSTLAVAGEPLSARQLAVLSDVDSAGEHCHRTLRPFLSAVDGPDGRQFAWYHASLREFLTGVRPGEDGQEQDWKWWDVLSSAATAAHDRICSHHLTSARTDGYALRHLARHLVAAGREDDLHRLLREPSWFAAHDHADTIDDYLSDVALARAVCARETDRALAARQPAPTLCDEVRYDLVVASIVSRTNAISAELVAALVSGGVWTRARAVAHALRLPTATARAHVLAVLGAADLALAEAARIESAYARAEVLLKLIPLDPGRRPDLVAKTLRATADITGEHQRAGALADLAPWLTADQRHTALTLARHITQPHARARALTALGDHAGALAAVRAISGEKERAEALAALASHTPDLPAALTVAHAITGPHRLIAIAALASRLPDRDEVLADLLTTPVPDHQAEVYTALARHLPDAIAPALAAVTEDPSRAEALAPLLTEPQLTEALRTAGPQTRARCLTALAQRLPDPRRTLRRAHEAAREITDAHDRAEALTRLAPLLPAAPRRQALLDALAAATAVPPENRDLPAGLRWPGPTRTHSWSETLATTSARLRTGDPHDPRSRSAALSDRIPHLSATELHEALDAAPYGDRDLLCALVLRADEVAGDAEFVALLRRVLRGGISRATCTAVLAAALSRLAQVAGEDVTDRIGDALADVHRWWP
ncbi:NACHT domain-containing protein [Lentzea sp. NPDC004782]|uniref:NACHT domain-containing protein n=1 Tax=Lentzea sp. NPDC004782 TaxID=3154458 RepID=UPI00339EE74F